ncbi:MAG: hypothetical protein LR017_03755 [Candidatus Pacebacteria bacterium]|nr:hypothetical protein [Candidatus Paceibacterota bacterium]
MRGLTILPGYLAWHYTRAFGDITRVWINFLWFTEHFFSIRLLLRTLFAPWRRIVEERTKRFDIEDILGTIVVNVFSRFLGALVRLPIICVGVLALCLVCIGGVCLYVIWCVAPLMPLFFMVYGSVLIL